MFFFSSIAKAFKRWKRNKSFMGGGTPFVGTPGGEMVNIGTITDFKMTMKEPSDEQWVRESLEEGKCPDCGSMKFFSGPTGHGSCEYYMCSECGRCFNVIFKGSKLIFIERIQEILCKMPPSL